MDVDEIKNGVPEPIPEPIEEKVSSERLLLTLVPEHSPEEVPNRYDYRKLIFPTNEYISYLDLAVLCVRLGKKIDFESFHYDGETAIESKTYIYCCVSKKKVLDPEAYLRDIYRAAILDKLKNYNSMADALKQKIKEYKQRARNQRHTLKTGKQFENKWVRRDVPDLGYVML
jgi:hypothetical protein